MFRNKFILATAIFFVYALFLDENDMFTIISHNSKLGILQEQTVKMQSDLEETRATLEKLEERSEIEKYAREKKLFKKDDEDVFVIFYE